MNYSPSQLPLTFSSASAVAFPSVLQSSGEAPLALLRRWRRLSEHTELEAQLRRKERRFRTLVENSPDVIVRFDRKMRFMFGNPAFEAASGLPPAQYTGKTGEVMGFPAAPLKALNAAAEQVIDEGRQIDLEFFFEGSCGARWFWGRLIPEQNEAGDIETLMLIARDITERKQTEERIRYFSFHDNVTGLYNRAYLNEEIKRLDTQRSLPISFILGDVNYLKLTNDTLGHTEGDRLLASIGEILRQCCRNEDIIGRWGGDEFAVLLPKTDAARAAEICSRIKQSAEEYTELPIPPRIALGCAEKKGPEQSFDLVLMSAEERMYEDKLRERTQTYKTVVGCLQAKVRRHMPDYDGHLERLDNSVRLFADALGLGQRERDYLEMLIPLHDIGKAAVTAGDLGQPRPLTPAEWGEMKRYPEVGFRIAHTFTETAKVADEIFSLCERWDGTGYPRGLSGEAIPLLSRIFTLVDSFDHMTHERPYRAAMSAEEALKEIQALSGSQFDPVLTDIFVRTFGNAGPMDAKEQVRSPKARHALS